MLTLPLTTISPPYSTPTVLTAPDVSPRLTSGFGGEQPPQSYPWSVCLVWEIDSPPQHTYTVQTLRVPSQISSQDHRPHDRHTLYPPQTVPTPLPGAVCTSSPSRTGHAAYFPDPHQRAKVLQVYPMQMGTAQICPPPPRVDCCLRKIFPQPHPRKLAQTVMNRVPV